MNKYEENREGVFTIITSDNQMKEDFHKEGRNDMELYEIAKYIVENDSKNDTSNIAKGINENNKEDWSELLEPLMDYYMYGRLHLCGCGNPEDTYEVIRKYLRIREIAITDRQTYDDVQKKYKEDLHIDTEDDLQYGLLQFLMYVLDENGFTEHGSSIGGCRLTKDGERLLTVLDYWHITEEYLKVL